MGRRPLLVVLGVVLVVAGAVAAFQGFSRPTAPYPGSPPAATADGAPEPGEAEGGPGWALAAGLLAAAGMALIGIGVGRWQHPRRPKSEADYTGPGSLGDQPRRPPTV